MNKEKRRYIFKDGKELILGDKMVVMGILNVTPDSFSDGGHWDTAGTAADHTKRMCRDGAGIIDMGAESTRPGSTPLTADQEWERLLIGYFISRQKTFCLTQLTRTTSR